MSVNSLKSPINHPSTFQQFIWVLFGHRAYARNHSDGCLILHVTYAFFITGLGLLGFHFFPFKIMGLMILLGFLLYGLFEPIRLANCAPSFGWIHLMIGTVGLYYHWHFGMTLFGYHFEFVLLWAYVTSGVLSILRFLWNAFIWKLLDLSNYQKIL